MTILNSNMLSIAPASPEVALEGMIGGQMSGQMEALSVNIENLDQPLLEGDFWSLLSQQLAEISADEDLPDIENNLAIDWVQGIKSQFTEPEIVLTDEITETVETLPETPVPVVSVLNLTEIKAASPDKNGDKLPPFRQTVSAVLPLQTSPIATSHEKIAVSDGIEMIDVESDDKLPNPRHTEFELKKSEVPETEKLQVKQPVLEQVVSVTKENAASVLAQVNQLSFSAPQNQTTQPLSTSLQTMQLSPQATTSQWGEALGERVSLLLNNKLNTAEIRIDPPHLGKLDIQISIKEDSAAIVINTQHAQTRDLIDAASIRLRDYLQEAGYNSVDVEVSHREQSMAQGDLSQHENEEQNENSDQQQSARSELSEMHQGELSLKVANGRIDYFA